MARLRPDDPQRFTPGALRILAQHRKADTTKAQTELGYRPTSIEDAVREAYDFFGQRGMIAGYEPERAPASASVRQATPEHRAS